MNFLLNKYALFFRRIVSFKLIQCIESCIINYVDILCGKKVL